MGEDTPTTQSEPTPAAGGGSAAGRPGRRVFLVAAAAVVVAAVILSFLLKGSHSSRHASPAVTEAREAAARSNVRTAASYLGISPLQLRKELRSGRTLAQIAASTPGKSPQGIAEALGRSREAALSAALAGGKISSAQEREQLAALHARTAAEVSRAHGAGKVAGAAHAAAAYLGIPVQQLRREVEKGHSLAEIAELDPRTICERPDRRDSRRRQGQDHRGGASRQDHAGGRAPAAREPSQEGGPRA